jgi:repressor LexA
MSNLSDRQQRILQFIISFFNENNFPPTIREIGERVGISSTSVVNYNLTKLEDLNLINRRKEVSRGLNINWEEVANLNIDLPAVEPLLSHAARFGATAPSSEERNGAAGYGGGLMQVPVLGAIAAGEPIQVEARDQSNADEWVSVPDGLVPARGPLFALRVKGDSMIDASVLDGDYVIIRHQETANDGDMVAAWIEGDEETTLKYLYREGPNVRLQPANPEYQPIIRPANRVRINGKVVSVLRVLPN